MKTSAGLFLTDILPHKRKLLNKIIKNNVLDDIPHKIAFTKLKSSGVEGIELLLPSFQDITFADITEVKGVLGKYKMPILSVHQAITFFSKTKLSEITKLFHIADMLGAKVIVLHVSLIGKQIFKKEFVDTIHSLQKKYNIRVGFENRERILKTVRDKHHWHHDHFATLLKNSGLLITLDTTHLAQAGGDIIKFFKKNKDSIINIHISDYHELKASPFRILQYKHLPFGEGTLPINEFLTTLRQEQYKGLVTMEIRTDLGGMCECARIIKKNIT